MGPNRPVYGVMAAAVVLASSLLFENVEGAVGAAVTSAKTVSTRLPTAPTNHYKVSQSRAPKHVAIAPTRLATPISIGSNIRAPAPRTRGARRIWAAKSAFEPQAGLAEPQTGLSKPQTGLAVPQTGLTEPQTGFGEPLPGLAEPETDLPEPPPGLAEPETDLAEPETGIAEPETGIPTAEQVAAIKLQGLEAVKAANVAAHKRVLLENEQHGVRTETLGAGRKMLRFERAMDQLVAEQVKSIEEKGLDAVNEELQKVEVALQEKKRVEWQMERATREGNASRSLSGGSDPNEEYSKAYVDVLEAQEKALRLQVAKYKLEQLEEKKKAWTQAANEIESAKAEYVAERKRLLEDNAQHSERPEMELTTQMLLLEKAIQEKVAEQLEWKQFEGLDAVLEELEKAKLALPEKKRLETEKDRAAGEGQASQSLSGWSNAKEEYAKAHVDVVEAARRVLVLQATSSKLQGLEAVKEAWAQTSSQDERDLLEEAMRELLVPEAESIAEGAVTFFAPLFLQKAKMLHALRMELLKARGNLLVKKFWRGSAKSGASDADLKEAEIRVQVLIQTKERLIRVSRDWPTFW